MEQMMPDSVCPRQATKIFRSLQTCWGWGGEECLPDHRFGNQFTVYMSNELLYLQAIHLYPKILFVFQ